MTDPLPTPCGCCGGLGRVMERVWTPTPEGGLAVAPAEERECPRCNGTGVEPADEDEEP